MKAIQFLRRALAHGRTIEKVYRASCVCGWVGPWSETEWDAELHWLDHKQAQA